MAFLYNQANNVPQGQLTQTIYSLVRDQRFNDAVQLLEQQLQVGWNCTCGNTPCCLDTRNRVHSSPVPQVLC